MTTSGIYFDTILDENLIFQYSIKTVLAFFFIYTATEDILLSKTSAFPLLKGNF